MGAVTTASNSTSWTNSSSPKKKGEQESEKKDISLTRCLREFLSMEHLLGPGQWSNMAQKEAFPCKAENRIYHPGWQRAQEQMLQLRSSDWFPWKLRGRVWVWKCGQVRCFQTKLFVRPSFRPSPWLNRLSTIIASNLWFELSSRCPVEGHQTPCPTQEPSSKHLVTSSWLLLCPCVHWLLCYPFVLPVNLTKHCPCPGSPKMLKPV